MIPDIIELNFPKKDGKQYATLTQATANIADMGEKTITTQVKIDGEIVPDFSFDWEVKFQGEKYIMPLRIPQGAKENTSLNSTIDLTFQHWAIFQLKRYNFTTIQQIAAGTYLADEEEASVSLNLGDFCILLGQVLEYYYGEAITIDFNDDPVTGWQYKQEATIITISHTKIWNVLIDALHKQYGVRWEIRPTSDCWEGNNNGEKYVIRVGYPTTEVNHIFEYGFDGGLLKIERQVQSEEIRNVLKGRGGEKNMPRYYFKRVPNAEKEQWGYADDPDWVVELKDIYFTRLMPATFRSYIQGWKAAHINQTDEDGNKLYEGYTAVGETNAYAPWAYRKGYTDTKFRPVEFVADEITLTPASGDRQIEIQPGYSPYIKKGSSIDLYGPLHDTLENNDDIHPTLQGTGLDHAIAIEHIESDDIAATTEGESRLYDLPGGQASRNMAGLEGGEILLTGWIPFTVETGHTANLEMTNLVCSGIIFYENTLTPIADHSEFVEVLNTYIRVRTKTTQQTVNSPVGIPAGDYEYCLAVNVRNNYESMLTVTAYVPGVKMMSSVAAAQKWKQTFEMWSENVWSSSKTTTETNSQYAERVWKPILGDREGSKAKVVFTSGNLATSEDYEFAIIGYPMPDDSKTWTDAEGVMHTSHWRLKLAKSDADMESQGVYIPSTKKQGMAGDTFVFIGIEMQHSPYVTNAEERLDEWKKQQLGEVSEIKPTFTVTTDRIKMNQQDVRDVSAENILLLENEANLLMEGGGTFVMEDSGITSLLQLLRPGNSIRLADKRFIQSLGDRAYETLYLQSITYKYREPSSDDNALNPDVEITLGNEYESSASPVSTIQADVSALQKQVGAVSNIEQIVRLVGDKLYLRKDGIADRSLSPTEFASLLTSDNFRQGILGGAGWGFFKDSSGAWVLEADKMNIRQEMQVNSFVVNQLEARGGMIVESAASMLISRVEKNAAGNYICYFDQKGGSVVNLFKTGDIAYCERFSGDFTDSVRRYKRQVLSVGDDNVVLMGGGLSATMDAPIEGDVIVQWGSVKDATRRFVIVRDVINGGYERYIGGLSSISSPGTEYFYIGRQVGMWNNKPRFFVGDDDSYIEYVNGQLNIKGRINAQSTIGDKNIGDYISEEAKAGLVISGVNLLRNTNHGTKTWRTSYSSGAGNFSIKDNTSGKGVVLVNEATTTETGWQLVYIPLQSELIQLGTPYMLSFRAKAKTTPVKLQVQIRNISAANWLTGQVDVPLSTTEQRYEVPFNILKNPDADVAYAMCFYVSSTIVWDEIEIVDVKLEAGNVATEWSPSPLDFDYLTSALEESTVTDGGLILTSLIKVGTNTNADTLEQTTMAGISGIYNDTPGARGGIAVWTGGDMSDLGDPDRDTSKTPATTVLRHDGSAYFSNNTVRFAQNVVEVGDSVELNADGLVLNDSNGKQRLKIANVTVGDDIDIDAANVSLNLNLTKSVTLGLRSRTTTKPGSSPGSLEQVTEQWWVVKGGDTSYTYPIPGELTPGASINIKNCSVSINTYNVGETILPLVGNVDFKVGRYNSSGQKEYILGGQATGSFASQDTGVYTANSETIYVPTQNIEGGNYFIEVNIAVSSATTTRQVVKSAALAITGTAYNQFESTSVLGNDGLLSIWGNTGLLVNKDKIVLRAGDTILRISASGIQKSSDGGNSWAKL